MDDLFTEYRDASDEIERLESALATAKARRSGVAQSILERHGKGPHDLGDGRDGGYVVAVRGSSAFCVPVRKKGTKAA